MLRTTVTFCQRFTKIEFIFEPRGVNSIKTMPSVSQNTLWAAGKVIQKLAIRHDKCPDDGFDYDENSLRPARTD